MRGPAMTRCALVMAGGTGGHLPGLAVAEALRERAWQVHWLGAAGSMESQLVPPRGFAFETISFSACAARVGDAGLTSLRLLKAFWQSIQVVRRVEPDVVIGLGGYISFPAGMMSVLLGKPWCCMNRTRSPAWPTGCWRPWPTRCSPLS